MSSVLSNLESPPPYLPFLHLHLSIPLTPLIHMTSPPLMPSTQSISIPHPYQPSPIPINHHPPPPRSSASQHTPNQNLFIPIPVTPSQIPSSTSAHVPLCPISIFFIIYMFQDLRNIFQTKYPFFIGSFIKVFCRNYFMFFSADFVCSQLMVIKFLSVINLNMAMERYL